MIEAWKKVGGYDYYEVSNLGKVRSLDKVVNYRYGLRTISGKLLKQAKTFGGYYFVILTKDNEPKTHLIHRLVAQAFISNPNKYKTVDHLDFNKANNCISNLDWCDLSTNIKRYCDANIRPVGSQLPDAKIKESDVLEIRKSNKSQSALGRQYGITQSAVHKIIYRKSWKHLKEELTK